MCYHTKLNAKPEEIEDTFEANFESPEDYIPREEINGFDFLKTSVIIDEDHSKIKFFNWGLVPEWAENEEIKKVTLNAKIETADEKPAFQNAVNHRCLVIAQGFYEWHWFDTKGRNKQKYLIEVKNQPIFAFAGIYSFWKNPLNGNELFSYSILTTEGNPLMKEIHNTKGRMPVILKREDHQSWLDHASLKHFEFPYEVELLATETGNSQFRLF